MTRNDWTRAENADLFDSPFTELVFRASEVHRAHHAAGEAQPCTLVSIKTGGCKDTALFAKLGLKPHAAEEPMRVAAE